MNTILKYLTVIVTVVILPQFSLGGGWRTLPRGKYAKPGSRPLVVWDDDVDEDEDTAETISAPRFVDTSDSTTKEKTVVSNTHAKRASPCSDGIDDNEAHSSTGLHEAARQMRLQATQCRNQVKQAQMYIRQMSMYAAATPEFTQASAMSMNNMAQVSAQFAELYDKMADEWESLDEEEREYFRNMKNATSKQERTEMFIDAKNKLQRLISASNAEGAWKHYVTTRRAIMAFRRSINAPQRAEEWVRSQDEYYARLFMQAHENLRQNAMNMAMQSFAGANESFKKSLEASKLPSRRCGRCSKEYYGWGNCPQCSGSNYGLSSTLIKDRDHPNEKVRVYW